MRTFFCLEPPGHKKRRSGKAFKNRTIFWSMLGSARRASGGFPSRRQLNFHFCSRPKKGSKMGAKMEPFGLPSLNYTHFGPPFVRNWCQKSSIEKRLQNKVTPRLGGVQCTGVCPLCLPKGRRGGGGGRGSQTPGDPKGSADFVVEVTPRAVLQTAVCV